VAQIRWHRASPERSAAGPQRLGRDDPPAGRASGESMICLAAHRFALSRWFDRVADIAASPVQPAQDAAETVAEQVPTGNFGGSSGTGPYDRVAIRRFPTMCPNVRASLGRPVRDIRISVPADGAGRPRTQAVGPQIETTSRTLPGSANDVWPSPKVGVGASADALGIALPNRYE
jgi:hypothetical protein